MPAIVGYAELRMPAKGRSRVWFALENACRTSCVCSLFGLNGQDTKPLPLQIAHWKERGRPQETAGSEKKRARARFFLAGVYVYAACSAFSAITRWAVEVWTS